MERILRLIEKSQKNVKPEIDWDVHHALALKVAEQGAVLLKNEDQILPLAESDMVLIGHMAANIRYQGSGSSHINPTKLVNITDAMPDVPCCACGDAQGNVSAKDQQDAVEAAKKRKIAVVVVGLPDSYESEAFDREHMRLPDGHNALVDAVAQANPNTVVVLLGGSAMELPWADKVKAILYMGLPGQAGGQAVANLLTGKANPCGKLTETWPLSYEDVISGDTFGKKNTEYREGIYGENHFVIAPRPGGSFAHAKASYRSIFGEVESGWEKTESGYTFMIRIPENTSAMVILPDGSNQTVAAGTHKLNWTN